MTNREKLNNMTNLEICAMLEEICCKAYDSCYYCPLNRIEIKGDCGKTKLMEWFDQEAGDGLVVDDTQGSN